MNREDYLDYLIERRLSDAAWQLEASGDDAARMVAAEAVASLNTIEPPPSLSERLESRIRARARAQQNGHLAAPQPRPPSRGRARHIRLRRSWVIALSAAAALLLVAFGVANLASRSLPGDPLYGLKRFEQQIALANAGGPADRANLQITQLQSAVADLEAEVGAGRSDADIAQALSIVATQTHDSQAAVAALPAGAERDAAEQSLERELQNERATLYRLLARIDWSLRLAFTQQLGTLGASVPTLAQVTVTEWSDNTLTVTLTGTNFAPGARLVINGAAQGTVSQSSTTKLTAHLSESAWHEEKIAVGVLNPDGTAAQKIVSGDDRHGGSSGGGDDHGGQGTPTSTPEPGDDGGGHSGPGGGGSGSGGSGSGGGDDGGGSGGSGGGSGPGGSDDGGK